MLESVTAREGGIRPLQFVGGIAVSIVVIVSVNWVGGHLTARSETRAREEHAMAWSAVVRANAHWAELTPRISQITNTRQAISATAMTQAAWLAELGDLGGLMGGPLGVHNRAAQAMAEAQAQIAIKGPEVIRVVDQMGRAIVRMLDADAALPSDASGTATRNEARSTAQEWETAANEMLQVMAVDVFSAGDVATRFNDMTTEVMAALERLRPVTSGLSTGSR